MRIKSIQLGPTSVYALPASEYGCAETEILAHIDILYPVAMKYTGDERLASLLTEKTVMAALRDREALAERGALKPALLALLRSIYVKSCAQTC